MTVTRPDRVHDRPIARSEQGYYRVGKRLDADGNVTGRGVHGSQFPIGSRSKTSTAPSPFDLDGDGNSELVVLMVDNPPAKTRANIESEESSMQTGERHRWLDSLDRCARLVFLGNQGASVAVMDVEIRETTIW